MASPSHGRLSLPPLPIGLFGNTLFWVFGGSEFLLAAQEVWGENHSISWQSDAVDLWYRTWERRRGANRSWRVWWKAVVSVIWRIDLETVQGGKNTTNPHSLGINIPQFKLQSKTQNKKQKTKNYKALMLFIHKFQGAKNTLNNQLQYWYSKMKNLIAFSKEELLSCWKIVGEKLNWGQQTLVLVHFFPFPPLDACPWSYTDTPNLPFFLHKTRGRTASQPKIFAQLLLHYV